MVDITLTEKERAVLHRRRESLTQKKAAEQHGIQRNAYAKRENDGKVDCEAFEPTALELAYIRRKRLEMTQMECAALLGISRFWFCQMEKGNVPYDQLIKFWENRLGR